MRVKITPSHLPTAVFVVVGLLFFLGVIDMSQTMFTVLFILMCFHVVVFRKQQARDTPDTFYRLAGKPRPSNEQLEALYL